jgi:hypothetical protein
MLDRRVRSVREYLELLDGAPEELDALVSSRLIKVTSFEPVDLTRKIYRRASRGRRAAPRSRSSTTSGSSGRS